MTKVIGAANLSSIATKSEPSNSSNPSSDNENGEKHIIILYVLLRALVSQQSRVDVFHVKVEYELIKVMLGSASFENVSDRLIVKVYWSESESDIAWNGYLDFLVVCLHSDVAPEWVATQFPSDVAFAFARI